MSNTVQNTIDLLTSSNIAELVLGSKLLDETNIEDIQAFVDDNPDLDSVKRWILIQDISSILTEQDFATAVSMWDKSLEQAILFQLSEYDQILLERAFAFESLEVSLKYQNEAGYGIACLESPNEFIAKIEPNGGTCHTYYFVDLSGEVDSQELIEVASFLLDDWTSEDLGIDWEGNDLGNSWDVWYLNSKLKLITNDSVQFPNFDMFEEELGELDFNDYECGFASNSSYIDECTISFYGSTNDEDGGELLESEVSLEFLFAWMIANGANIAVRPTRRTFATIEKRCVLEVAENRYGITADDWNCLF